LHDLAKALWLSDGKSGAIACGRRAAAGSTPDERWMNAAAQADALTIPGRGELSEIYNKASQTRFKSCNRIAPKAS
jgi:hypothetical protein